MVTIVADDRIPFLAGALEPHARVVYFPGSGITRETLAGADGLITRTRTLCNRDLLSGTPVKFIATATIGFDHIDADYCAEQGIQWHHAPGCNASSVKQYVASALAILAQKKRISLEGKTVGIVGVGHVGSQIEALAGILGMKTLLNDPPRAAEEGREGFCELLEICEKADLVTFHVPLTLSGSCPTRHMAGPAFFSALTRKPLIINTSRGAVIDQPALIRAARDGKISGFAADVWENEPVIEPELLKLSIIATPHIAGYSVEGKANGTAACVRAASRFFGFGIDDWYPDPLPGPARPLIRLTTRGRSDEQLILEAFLAAYDIMGDDRALRSDPASFEQLRDHYPVRREFGAFTVVPDETRPGLEYLLGRLGFNVRKRS